MIRFISSLLIVSVVLLGIMGLLVNSGILNAYPSYLWHTLIFLNFSTAVIFFYLVRFGTGVFVQLYLLSMVLKLLAYGAFNLLIILWDRPNAGINVGFFMITYLLFTTLELAFLYRKMNG